MNTETLDMKLTTHRVEEGEIYDSEHWMSGTTATDQLSDGKDINVLADTTRIIAPYHAVDNAVVEKVIEEVERPEDPTCVEDSPTPPTPPTPSTYTVNFYNGETLLDTVEVESGGTAVYTGEMPSQEGYVFIGWSPVPTNVTENMDCYAQFKEIVIEDAEISDDWDTILTSIEDGTYLTKYNFGNYKPLDLGAQGVINMQLVAFSADELADGTGYAKTAWIGKEVLSSSTKFNTTGLTPGSAPYDEGTGYIGGWEKSDIRAYMKDTIKPLIPSTVSSAIKEVKKYSDSIDTSGTLVPNSVTIDDVWNPSANEVGFSNHETQGASYSIIYTDDTSRQKGSGGQARSWWTRTSIDASHGVTVFSDGTEKSEASTTGARRPVLGFCL